MAGRKSTESQLAELAAIEPDPTTEAAVATLRAALGSRSNFVVARAAEIVAEWQLMGFGPEMNEAFRQYMIDPLRRDPTCVAKQALAEAGAQTGTLDEAVYLAGLAHRQLEPVYGGREDTAAALRATCAVGLARLGYPDIMRELAQLLADTELDARLGAVQAIPYVSQPGGLPLLWYKTLLGDEEPAVVLACFNALLMMAPDQAVPLVGSFLLSDDDPVAESAALALGESHLAAALPLLANGWEQAAEPSVRRTMLLAVALLRSDAGVDMLLDVLAEGDRTDKQAALNALELYRHDERVWTRVDAVIASRNQ